MPVGPNAAPTVTHNYACIMQKLCKLCKNYANYASLQKLCKLCIPHFADAKQISVADAARSRWLSLTAQSSVALGRSRRRGPLGPGQLEAALRRSPSKHISVADAAGTPLARKAQSHCGSYETEILIGAGRDRLGFFDFFQKNSGLFHAYIPGGLCRICRILLRNAVPSKNGYFSGTN